MIREAFGVADTVDEAIRLACSELGVSPDDASIEIIDYPKPKTFGLFGGSPAKVRVSVGEEEPVVEKTEARPAPKPEKPAQKKEKPAEQPKREQHRKEEPKRQEPVVEAPEAVEVSPAAEQTVAPAPVVDESQLSEPARTAADYLRRVLKDMGLTKIVVVVTENEEGAQLELTGEGLGTAIGRRGETLMALQYLVSLAANNKREGYYRVSVNIGNYKEKREQVLETLAKKVAARALKINKNLALEPMNPYERRIVHTFVHDIEGVTSWSVGEDSKRHVVIGPVGLAEGEDGLTYNGNRGRSNNNSRGGYNRGGNRGNRSRGGYNKGGYNRGGNRGGYNRGGRSSSYSQAPSAPAKSDFEGGSLYGRIEVPKKNEE